MKNVPKLWGWEGELGGGGGGVELRSGEDGLEYYQYSC